MRLPWLGTSIEAAEQLVRLQHLRRTPAVRFVSFEPLLGGVGEPDLSGIDWAIVGGESGPSARPTQEAWAEGVRAACRRHGVGTLVVGGGFTANSQLRELMAARCADAGIELRIPPIRYCTDNGAMIAALGAAVVRRGLPASPLDLAVDSSMPLTQVLA